MTQTKRTQQERRKETQSLVLMTACELFGEKGFEKTGLEDIASAGGITTSPIYHYYKGKKHLFEAATELMELKLSVALKNAAESTEKPDITYIWNAFIQICNDKAFRQIVLIDAPNVLGRDRWIKCAAFIEIKNLLLESKAISALTAKEKELSTRMLLSALGEAAIMIGESDNPESSGKMAYNLIERIARGLL